MKSNTLCPNSSNDADEIQGKLESALKNNTSPHPLGSLIRSARSPRPWRVRLIAGVILTAVASVEVIAAWLSPDGSGMGTHCQLGLPPCAMVLIAGIPCPTCGMTTAFAHTIRGQLLAAAQAQPFGFLMAVAAWGVAAASAYSLATGHRVEINWYRIAPHRAALACTALFAAAWGYKVLVHLL